MSDPDVLAQWEQELSQAKARNQRLILGLHARGILPEESSILHAKIDCLVEAIAEVMGGNGEEFRLLAHVRWQHKLTEKLEEIGKEGNKAILAQGGSLTPGQVAHLARETGTAGWGKKP